MQDQTTIRPMAPETDDMVYVLALAELELLRIEVDMARLQHADVAVPEEPYLHDLSPLGQRTLGAV